jgi:hypothetical protein
VLHQDLPQPSPQVSAPAHDPHKHVGVKQQCKWTSRRWWQWARLQQEARPQLTHTSATTNTEEEGRRRTEIRELAPMVNSSGCAMAKARDEVSKSCSARRRERLVAVDYGFPNSTGSYTESARFPSSRVEPGLRQSSSGLYTSSLANWPPRPSGLVRHKS